MICIVPNVGLGFHKLVGGKGQEVPAQAVEQHGSSVGVDSPRGCGRLRWCSTIILKRHTTMCVVPI